MIDAIVRRVFYGLGYGGLMIFGLLSFYRFSEFTLSLAEIWQQALGALVVGVYFGIASLFFLIESWSPLKQTMIHFLTSLVVFFPTVLWAGWMPIEFWTVLSSFVIFLVIYTLLYTIIYNYNKRILESLNDGLK